MLDEALDRAYGFRFNNGCIPVRMCTDIHFGRENQTQRRIISERALGRPSAFFVLDGVQLYLVRIRLSHRVNEIDAMLIEGIWLLYIDYVTAFREDLQ